jgi:predicted aspartyl protease
VSLTCDHQGVVLTLDRVVVDTGAAITVLDQQKLRAGGLVLDKPQQEHWMVGTGGGELATSYKLQRVAIGDEIQVLGFAPHVGPAHYGRDLGGLLGLDFLELTGAIINLTDWTIDFVPAVQSAG